MNKGNYVERREEFGAKDGKKKCSRCEQIFPVERFHKSSTRYDGYGYYCRSCHRMVDTSTNTYKSKMLTRARKRAKEQGVPFNLCIEDIDIPDKCPVLGIDLSFGGGVKERNNSPSIDRFVPSLGYVPGNIAIISHRANLLKNNGTLEEILMVIDWMKSKTR